MAEEPGIGDILRRTLIEAPPATRRRLVLIAAIWVTMVALQIWDIRGRSGPAVWAELASVLLLTSGTLLVALIHILGAAEEDHPGDAPVIRQIMLASPTVCFVAGCLLAAGMATVVARVLLGASTLHLAVLAVNIVVLVAAARASNGAARSLYRYAQAHAAAAARAEAQSAEARLVALQAQMNPHFLFNALNTVAALVRTDPRAAESTVEHLSGVLRRTLERSRAADSTLGEEIEYVESYVAIEAERLGPRLTMEWAIDDAVRTARLPPLTIQPLVENAITHAIAPRLAGGCIRVAAAGARGRLRLTVEDDGEGFGTRTREGTGLGNLRKRLATLYGAAASLGIESSPSGSRVTIELPLQPAIAHAARADR